MPNIDKITKIEYSVALRILIRIINDYSISPDQIDRYLTEENKKWKK